MTYLEKKIEETFKDYFERFIIMDEFDAVEDAIAYGLELNEYAEKYGYTLSVVFDTIFCKYKLVSQCWDIENIPHFEVVDKLTKERIKELNEKMWEKKSAF